MWLGVLSIIMMPFVAGILRKQTHRCQKCLNQFKSEDYLEQLNDKILEFSIYNFGVIVRRKTLMQLFAFIFACLLLGGVLEWRSFSETARELKIDRQLTWELY